MDRNRGTGIGKYGQGHRIGTETETETEKETGSVTDGEGQRNWDREIRTGT